MRNVFDQYSQPENRLTHALLSALSADRRLLGRFLKWSVAKDVRGSRLSVAEQSLPGELAEIDEDEAERRGLPDGCISDGTGWALLIESKAAARISVDQLQRHRRTAARRGIGPVQVLVISIGAPPARLPTWVMLLRWSQVYAWLRNEARRSLWAATAADYLEVAEMRGAADGYLPEGTLTEFAGIPFGPDNPYTYPQAKQCSGYSEANYLPIRVFRESLRPIRTAKVAAPSLGAVIRESGTTSACMRHVGHRSSLSYLILRSVCTTITLRQVRTPKKSRALMIGGVTRALVRALQPFPGAVPNVTVVQRTYQTQRSQPTVDCMLHFDPRTALAAAAIRGRVKEQPHWLRVTYEVLKARRSNLQFQVGAEFPYATCPAVHESRIARAVADTWIACAPDH